MVYFMKKGVWVFLILCVLSVGGVSAGQDPVDPLCNNALTQALFETLATLKKPPALTKDPERVLAIYEYQTVGEIVQNKDFFKNQTPGTFLFLIDADLDVIVSRRTPDRKADLTGPHLATHLGLYNQLKILKPHKEPVIIGGGEYKDSFTKVSFVSNKAGTFLEGNGAESLKFSVQVLKLKGLAVEEGTWLKDYSQAAPPPKNHGPDRQLSAAEITYLNTEIYLSLERLLLDFYTRYPHPTIPGFFDAKPLRAVIAKLTHKVQDELWVGENLPKEQRQALRHEEELVRKADQYLVYLQNEGSAFVIDKHINGEGEVIPLSEVVQYMRKHLFWN